MHHDLHANYTSTLYDSEKETVMYAFMSLRELQMSQLQGPTKKDFRRAYFLQEYLLSFFSLRKCFAPRSPASPSRPKTSALPCVQGTGSYANVNPRDCSARGLVLVYRRKEIVIGTCAAFER